MTSKPSWRSNFFMDENHTLLGPFDIYSAKKLADAFAEQNIQFELVQGISGTIKMEPKLKEFTSINPYADFGAGEFLSFSIHIDDEAKCEKIINQIFTSDNFPSPEHVPLNTTSKSGFFSWLNKFI